MHKPDGAVLKPALAFAALLIIALGLIFYRRGQEREKTAGNNPPRTIEAPAPPSPAPSASPAHHGGKRRPAPVPRRRPDDSGQLFADVRSERLALDGASLLAIKKVHVDPIGDDPIGKQFRDQLTAALRANRRFTLTTNRDEADAVFKGKMSATRPEQVSATVRLVNAKGEVVWPVDGPVSGKQYQGPVAVITNQIARDLLAAMDKVERK